MTSDPIVLAFHVAAWKRAEVEAKRNRARAEDLLVGALGFKKSEGQETYEPESELGTATITCKQPINTTIDQEVLPAMLKDLPEAAVAFRVKYELDTKAARELQEKQPEVWLAISRAITRKPGKISVDVKGVNFYGAV